MKQKLAQLEKEQREHLQQQYEKKLEEMEAEYRKCIEVMLAAWKQANTEDESHIAAERYSVNGGEAEPLLGGGKRQDLADDRACCEIL
jgi:hypothetical protein